MAYGFAPNPTPKQQQARQAALDLVTDTMIQECMAMTRKQYGEHLAECVRLYSIIVPALRGMRHYINADLSTIWSESRKTPDTQNVTDLNEIWVAAEYTMEYCGDAKLEGDLKSMRQYFQDHLVMLNEAEKLTAALKLEYSHLFGGLVCCGRRMIKRGTVMQAGAKVQRLFCPTCGSSQYDEIEPLKKQEFLCPKCGCPHAEARRKPKAGRLQIICPHCRKTSTIEA